MSGPLTSRFRNCCLGFLAAGSAFPLLAAAGGRFLGAGFCLKSSSLSSYAGGTASMRAAFEIRVISVLTSASIDPPHLQHDTPASRGETHCV